MQGQIAQILGLAIHANAFLQGRDIGAFWPDATFFHFCRSVRFLAGERDGGEVERAADPTAWLRGLGARCRGVRVRSLEPLEKGRGDRPDMAFIDRGPLWRLAETGGERSVSWRPEWSVSGQEADADRPWSVAYHGIANGAGAAGPGLELGPAGQGLAEALQAIARFAERRGSAHARSFREALDCLSSEAPRLPPHYLDLAPPEFLSPPARRLLAASQIAWVFGGMGAWDDEDYGEKGNRLTETLAGRLRTAFAAVVDSTLPPAAEAVSRP